MKIMVSVTNRADASKCITYRNNWIITNWILENRKGFVPLFHIVMKLVALALALQKISETGFLPQAAL